MGYITQWTNIHAARHADDIAEPSGVPQYSLTQNGKCEMWQEQFINSFKITFHVNGFTHEINWAICYVLSINEYAYINCVQEAYVHGPLTRYVKLRAAHAPGMPGTFSPPPRVSDPDMHHGTCVTHVPWCMPGSLTSCFLWSRWRGKRSRHSRRMHNPQFYVSGKRPIHSLNSTSET